MALRTGPSAVYVSPRMWIDVTCTQLNDAKYLFERCRSYQLIDTDVILFLGRRRQVASKSRTGMVTVVELACSGDWLFEFGTSSFSNEHRMSNKLSASSIYIKIDMQEITKFWFAESSSSTRLQFGQPRTEIRTQIQTWFQVYKRVGAHTSTFLLHIDGVWLRVCHCSHGLTVYPRSQAAAS